jgi:hypothetical protein
MPERERDPTRPEVSLRAGSYVHKNDLAELARQAVERDGRSIGEIAEALDQKGPAVSRAINQPHASATSLRRELIALAGYRVEGPSYRLVKDGGE